MIERQIEQISSADQRILEVASVAGAEFSAAAVAAGLEGAVEEVEERCAEFTRRARFLRSVGTAEWPNGTVTARYEFLHALYQQVIYERIPTSRRTALHQRIGERLEQGYDTRTREIAAELAVHFERGRDFSRAIRYLRQAGENATRQSAHSEAINLFTKGLALLRTLPHTDERTQQEIRLHLALGLPLTTLKGYASPEVEYAYTRARQLCQQMGETRYLFPAVLGLGGVRQNQAEFRKARVLAQQLLRLARPEGDPARLLWAHVLSGQISYLVGKFALARQDFVEGIALYDAHKHSPRASDVVQDPGVHCRCYLAEILWIQGYADQAQQLSHQSLRLARQLTHSYSQAVALSSAVLLHDWVGKRPTARDLAEELIALTHQQGFPFWLAIGTVRRGWTLVAEGQEEQGLAQMRQGLTIFHTTGAKFAIPSFFCNLAEAHEMAGQVEEGLALVTAALKRIAKTGEHLSEAELYRLKGNLLVQKFQVLGSKFQVDNPQSAFSDPQWEAEACFLKAITTARKQQAKSLELRAVMSLVRLRQQQVTQSAARDTQHETHHRLLEAYRMLSDLYDWFTEGFETADLKEAKALLSAFQ